VEKVVDVVGLYHYPPERAVVLCVDEKSGIQALDRSQTVPAGAADDARADELPDAHAITGLLGIIVDGTAVKQGMVPRVAHVEGQPYESEAVPGGVGVPVVRHLPECATWRGCQIGCRSCLGPSSS
jgi:hypothetical protein